MTNELEEMKRMIEGQRKVFETNVDYLINELKDLKKISSAIGEVSHYDCLAVVKRDFNEKIDKMLRQ